PETLAGFHFVVFTILMLGNAATSFKVHNTLYGYDTADRLTEITQGTEKVSFAYDPANRRITQTLPNHVQTAYTYNNANQVTGLAWGKAGQAALGSLGYGYNTVGQLVAQTGTHVPQSLPTASSGNSFDDNNRQTKANNVALSYDESGHLLNDGSRSYIWDDRDRLSKIQQSGTTIASFSYDALGRRTVKTESSTSTQYLYDGQDPVQETQGSTVNPILTGLGIDQRYARNDTGGRTYFLTDHLGSTRLLTNAAGNVVQRYEYDPYGATTQSSTAYTNPYQYTGREKDLSGLYYYRARYYRPQWGRFISEDPIKLAGGVNEYIYVEDSPLQYNDPLGLWKVTISIFDFFGGALFFGKDENSGGFIGIRAGVGIGGGISFEPLGNASGSNPCSNGGFGLGGYGEVGFHALFIQAGIELYGGGKWTPSDKSKLTPYGDFQPSGSLGDSGGINAEASAGVELTLHGGRPYRH
ncbi:RHS repeat domain-containing protein, partial [Xanthomonas fragariae]|uniref:RHS repeat domain-containing protein n=2 Tax=Xanthomonas fragariae TaxID=48664 RepID=UPI0026658B9B